MKVKRLLAIILAIVMMAGAFTVAQVSVTAATYSTVRKGSIGEDVKTLQTMLNKVQNAGLVVDGKFGSGTLAAVKTFQKANGLKVDGVVGSATWAALSEKYNATETESTLKIDSGSYNPGTLTKGKSYAINGKITSDYKITSVAVGVYNSDGSATAQVKTVSPNSKSYNISKADSYIKFGSLAAGTYTFKATATDASGTTKVLVNNTFTVTASVYEAKLDELKANALANWVKPIRVSYLTVKKSGRAFGSTRDGGDRIHAGIDYYVNGGNGVAVYAMESGTVVEYISNFYYGTSSVAVKHADGSVLRYAEISTSCRVGDKITKGQQIGKIKANTRNGGTMLHLELYVGTSSGSFTNRSNTTYHYASGKKYQRRADLANPEFLLDITRTN